MKPGTKTINTNPAAKGAANAVLDPARIVKMSLVSNVVGAAAPSAGTVAEEQVSIEATGRAKFDAYTMSAAGGYDRLCHCKFAIGEEAARAAIDAAYALAQSAPEAETFQAGAWHLKLTDDAGKKYKFDGALGSDAAAKASETIRAAIVLPPVIAFDAR